MYWDVRHRKISGQVMDVNGKRGHSRGYIGLALGLVAAILFSVCDLSIKLLADSSQPVFASIRHTDEACACNVKLVVFLLLRGVVGCSVQILYVLALHMIDIGDASAIWFSSLVFVPLLAHVLLGEKTGIFPVFCALITFSGVVIIARPSMLTGVPHLNQQTLMGTPTALVLGAMILGAFHIILLRRLREVHYTVVMTSYGLIGCALCTVIALPAGVLGTFTFMAQVCVTLAYKFENAGPLSLMSTLNVVIAFILQIVFLGGSPHVYIATGASAVVLGVILVTMFKWMNELPADHRTRPA